MTSPAALSPAVPSPYGGARIAFGTMHGKERCVAPAFRTGLGATVTAAPGIDTDRFGTFTGTVPRRLPPLQVAAAKARLATELTGSPYGLASEATYTADLGLVVEHHELLLFHDRVLGITVTEADVTRSAADARTAESVDGALGTAAALGFPGTLITLSAAAGTGPVHRSGLASRDDLVAAAEELLALGGPLTVRQDHRAFADPRRREVLARLAMRLADRLRRSCPECAAPGWGQVDVDRGLPCRACGEPTAGIRADVLGCGRCAFRAAVPRGVRSIDPQWCDGCNP